MADHSRGRWPLLMALVLTLLVVAAASLLLGSNAISPAKVWHLLLVPDGTLESAVVREQRLPRTAVAAVVGAALGLAGALMQALTRNPIADPGILGVNAGAALAVVLAVAVVGTSGVGFYVWFAFIGAAVAAIGVYLLAGIGRPGGDPARLALAGVAVSAALTALTQTTILADQVAFNEFRTWVTGSLEGRGWAILLTVAPFIAVGVVISLLVAPALGVLSLGDDAAHGLGVSVARTRTLVMVAVTLLCGAATAAIGPIVFVGLAVPMIARSLYGHQLRWVCVGSLVLGAAWLLAADVLGRILVAPQEIPAGVVAAIAGAPLFVAVVRRPSMPTL